VSLRRILRARGRASLPLQPKSWIVGRHMASRLLVVNVE